MSYISTQIAKACENAILNLLGDKANDLADPVIAHTRKEFEGDYTLVVFPYTRLFGKKPEDVGQMIGDAVVENTEWISGYNVVKGFLNLSISDDKWTNWLCEIEESDDDYKNFGSGKTVIVEFSSPNTNKPLHLGHIRNILLGWSSTQLLEATGHKVIKTQIVNDRGIAICKSMLAWVKFGEGATPQSTGKKGDHFVGDFYVLFEKKFQEEYSQWQAGKGQLIFNQLKKEDEQAEGFFKRYKNQYFNEHSGLGKEAREMLQKWEDGDSETIAIWEKMNHWVYDGFGETYDKLGVSFDKIYYESNTYLIGKEILTEGLEKEVFYKKDDGSVWADLKDVKLDEKIVLRSDGTALYITQDLGTADLRYDDFKMDKAVYVVADEQDYHFQVLFELMKRLGRPFADDLHHLSYGMVDLPTGKMKSREGTVVDADDLIAEVISEAKAGATERGELAELSDDERNEIYRRIGLGALKYFILKVNPKKRMTFDPKDSLDMQGQTGPYIQNAFVRIQSILRKIDTQGSADASAYLIPSGLEKELIMQLDEFGDTIIEGAENLDPSAIGNYLYQLAKAYHRFYHEHRILTAESEEAKAFRLNLSNKVQRTLEKGMNLLGIEMPSKM